MKKWKPKGKSLNERFPPARQADDAVMPLPMPADPGQAHVAQFCQEIVPGAAPLAPMFRKSTGSSATDNCFLRVAEQINRGGGTAAYGWAIWETPGVLIEAEFHAVWRDKNGALVDLTSMPAGHGARRTFIEDPSKSWEEVQVDNIRKPLVDDVRVAEFIGACEANFRMMNRGLRRRQFGNVSIPTIEGQPVLERIARATNLVLGMLEERRTPNKP